MTEEGKIRLEEFRSVKEKYLAEKEQFELFASEMSSSYREDKKNSNGCLWIACILFLLICVFGIAGVKFNGEVRFLIVAAMVVCMVMNHFLKPGADEVRQLTSRYLAEKGYPKEDEELAFRVFTDAKVYSDLPMMKALVANKLIDITDLDDFDIDADNDIDFDGDD